MRIDSTRSTSGAKSARKSSATGDGASFRASLQQADETTRTAPPMASAQVGSVAALMALQGVEDPLEKRRRAERRGRQLLDGLDRLKMDVLEGRDPTSALLKLKTALESIRDDTGDSQLDSLLDQIELRAEVELAKRFRK